LKVKEIRALEGRNIYCHRPVIKMKVDLERYALYPTNLLEGFADRLVAAMPSLREHQCSRGRPGGFVERLAEGTYLGHVIEHVALELQNLAGMPVTFGKTLRNDEGGCYDIVFAYLAKEGAILAGKQAVALVEELLAANPVDVAGLVTEIRNVTLATELGPSTRSIIDVCRERDIPVVRLGEGSLLQLGYGTKQRRVAATLTEATSCIAADIAGDKTLTKQLLDGVGIPVPWGGVARTEDEAVAVAAKIRGSVVVKPYNGNQGKGVALDLGSEKEVRAAFRVSANYSDKMIVEKFITGRHYRVLVVCDRMVAASERVPAHVIGDGKHTIAELVEIVNQDPRRGEEHEKPLTRIRIDPVVLFVLAKKGLNLESVPAWGQVVFLRENANLSTGGTAIDVTEQVHPDNRDLAIRAARVVGLDVAGIDMVTADISLSLRENGGAVIEVNAAPGLRMHLFPAKGIGRNVASDIVSYLFPEGTPSRIPIVAVTGTNGKTTTTRLLGRILEQLGLRVGMATTDGVFINGRKIIWGDTTGPHSARAVLCDPDVEAAVLETARGGILRAGLGFDRPDVAVVTNISEDHLGQDGIETVAELAHVKSLLVESVPKEGWAVLNADDPLVLRMEEQAAGKVIYFSLSPDNVAVRRHLGIGGKAVFCRNSAVVVAAGNKVSRLVSVKEIPCTLHGIATHNIQNALAAIAAALALGVPFARIREGLRGFGIDPEDNPGRLMVRDIRGVKIIVDYGHNAAGYEQIISLAKKMQPNRLLGVIGVPGDRDDESIIRVGSVAGNGFNRLFIKEDQDLRGRRSGEVAELLKRGAEAAGMAAKRIKVVLPEVLAAAQALEQARRGDIVVIFYEKLEPVMELLHRFENLRAGSKEVAIAE
jgi:cyanophycin synthetase